MYSYIKLSGLHGAGLFTDQRQSFEEACLQALSRLPSTVSPFSTVRTPSLYHFNPETNTQVQEYLPASLDLKTYALKHFTSSETPESLKPQCLEIGRGLGRWLRRFHDRARQARQADLRDKIKLNKDVQDLKHTYNYSLLLWQVEKFSSILGEAKDVFQEVIIMAKTELEDEDTLQVIHSDFWTGKEVWKY